MRIINEYPPNIDTIRNYLSVSENNLFCYGDIIYNPSGQEIPDDLKVHEKVHMRQQSGIMPEVWWTRYLTDSKFRLDVEVEAYATQYRYIKAVYPAKAHKEALAELAGNLVLLYNIGDMNIYQAETMIRKHGA